MKQLVLLCTWFLLHGPASNRQQISVLHKDHWPCLGETVLVSSGSYLPLAMPFYLCSQKPHSSSQAPVQGKTVRFSLLTSVMCSKESSRMRLDF